MVENILILKNVVILIFFALFETKAQLTNIPANYERDWGHQITIEKMSDVLDLVQVHRSRCDQPRSVERGQVPQERRFLILRQ